MHLVFCWDCTLQDEASTWALIEGLDQKLTSNLESSSTHFGTLPEVLDSEELSLLLIGKEGDAMGLKV